MDMFKSNKTFVITFTTFDEFTNSDEDWYLHSDGYENYIDPCIGGATIFTDLDAAKKEFEDNIEIIEEFAEGYKEMKNGSPVKIAIREVTLKDRYIYTESY